MFLRAAHGRDVTEPVDRQASVERVAAGARAGGVRVVDGEALLLDGVDEVDDRALHVGRAHPVDRQGARRRSRRSGHRRASGRRRTGCSAGPRSRPAGPRCAAPGRRDPPDPAVTSPWLRRRRSGSRHESVVAVLVLNSHCFSSWLACMRPDSRVPPNFSTVPCSGAIPECSRRWFDRVAPRPCGGQSGELVGGVVDGQLHRTRRSRRPRSGRDARRSQRRRVEGHLPGQHQHRHVTRPGRRGQRADHLAVQRLVVEPALTGDDQVAPRRRRRPDGCARR